MLPAAILYLYEIVPHYFRCSFPHHKADPRKHARIAEVQQLRKGQNQLHHLIAVVRKPVNHGVYHIEYQFLQSRNNRKIDAGN